MSSVKERFAALLESLLGTQDAIEASAALAFLDAMQPEDKRITDAHCIARPPDGARCVMWYLTEKLKSEAQEVLPYPLVVVMPAGSTTGAMRAAPAMHACPPSARSHLGPAPQKPSLIERTPSPPAP